MAKVFYTERDIEDLAKQGVKSIAVTDNVVVTDSAREKAQRLGVNLLTPRDVQPLNVTVRQPAPAVVPPTSVPPKVASENEGDLETRIYNSVKNKLGGQVDDALLRTIVKRVLKSLGHS